MSETYLRVPVVQAVDWGEALDEKLAVAAQQAGIDFDGGEEREDHYVYAFVGISAGDLQVLAEQVLRSRPVRVSISGVNEVTVTVPPSSTWIEILGPAEHPYDRAMKDLATEFSETYGDWWAQIGPSRLLVQQSLDDGRHSWFFDDDHGDLLVAARLDLSILDRKATKAEAENAARANLQSVIDHVGEHFGLAPR